jgi:DNA-binding transcriptional LysR family regulator
MGTHKSNENQLLSLSAAAQALRMRQSGFTQRIKILFQW